MQFYSGWPDVRESVREFRAVEEQLERITNAVSRTSRNVDRQVYWGFGCERNG